MIAAQRADARILIVDDEPSILHLLADLLARSGYHQVRTTSDAGAAVALYREFQPDLVLLDLCMPRLDGFSLLALLREATPVYALVPVLVVSADQSAEAQLRARLEGASDYLVKPFGLRELLARVEALLDLRSDAETSLRQLRAVGASVDRSLQEASQTELQALATLSAACANHEGVSSGHAERVATLAAQLATELGLAPRTVKALRRCAVLHDVGKIAVPSHVLMKPGVLSRAEMVVTERHTTLGALILCGSPSPLLKLAGEIALAHHERWDGAGYPRRLTGPDIPVAARIVAVADVFDALTHERPYKHAWSVELALSEVVANSGSHFDPAVVAALVRLVPRVAAGSPDAKAA
jgi:putative two-component system response regulator